MASRSHQTFLTGSPTDQPRGQIVQPLPLVWHRSISARTFRVLRALASREAKARFFCSGCPNARVNVLARLHPCHAGRTPTGFSKATCSHTSQALCHSSDVHSTARSRSSCFGCPSPYHRFPLTARAVQGGCKIITSHRCRFNALNTFSL